MGNQKIIKCIKQIAISFLFFGITTMNYAENFGIKHIYTPVVKVLGQHSSTVTFPVYYPIAISNDNYVITENLSDTFSIKSEDFGIYKTPLTEEMKKKTNEINKILRMPYIEKMVLINDSKSDLLYELDKNNEKLMMNKYINGFQRSDTIKLDNFHSQQERRKAQRTIQISNYISDLAQVGYSKNKEKFADFYGTTNIIPKKEGLEVIVTLKNVGPFDVTVSSPNDFQDISKDQYYDDSYKKWYELRIGGLYKEIGFWIRIFLLSDYLIKENLKSDELKGDLLTVKSDSDRVIKFLIPYKHIKVELSNGEVDTNRTKEGYIHLDHNTAIILSNWNMYIDFGDIFSKEQTWKEEKSSQVKGWINLE